MSPVVKKTLKLNAFLLPLFAVISVLLHKIGCNTYIGSGLSEIDGSCYDPYFGYRGADLFLLMIISEIAMLFLVNIKAGNRKTFSLFLAFALVILTEIAANYGIYTFHYLFMRT